MQSGSCGSIGITLHAPIHFDQHHSVKMLSILGLLLLRQNTVTKKQVGEDGVYLAYTSTLLFIVTGSFSPALQFPNKHSEAYINYKCLAVVFLWVLNIQYRVYGQAVQARAVSCLNGYPCHIGSKLHEELLRCPPSS